MHLECAGFKMQANALAVVQLTCAVARRKSAKLQELLLQSDYPFLAASVYLFAVASALVSVKQQERPIRVSRRQTTRQALTMTGKSLCSTATTPRPNSWTKTTIPNSSNNISNPSINNKPQVEAILSKILTAFRTKCAEYLSVCLSDIISLRAS